MHKSKTKSFINKNQSGMTLIELLVVLAIFIIVTGITIFDYGKFRSSVSLQNLADDIALSVRRAQNYAIGVHSSSQSQFTGGYGIHFSNVPAGSLNNPYRAGSNKAFVLFNDLNPNRFYDYTNLSSICNINTLSATDECVDMLNISSGDIISSICYTAAGTSFESCLTPGYVDITFLRPNPDARICVGNAGGACSIQASEVSIEVKNNQTLNTKIIKISNVGQISIE